MYLCCDKMNVIIAIIAKFRIEVFDERQQVLFKKKKEIRQ